MNRFDIINTIGDKYRIGNTETSEFSYVQALKVEIFIHRPYNRRREN